jgi:septum formation protein
MRALGLAFRVEVSHIELQLPPGDDPCDPVPVAVAKVLDIASALHSPTSIIGADTIVVDGTDAVGKPVDANHAVEMLMHLRGREHAVRTGVAIAAFGEIATLEVSSPVRMRTFNRRTAQAYVATGEPLDCAGSYDARAGGAALVEPVIGCLSAVVGFPVAAIAQLLQSHAGISSRVGAYAACEALCNAPCRARDPKTAHGCVPTRVAH